MAKVTPEHLRELAAHYGSSAAVVDALQNAAYEIQDLRDQVDVLKSFIKGLPPPPPAPKMSPNMPPHKDT